MGRTLPCVMQWEVAKTGAAKASSHLSLGQRLLPNKLQGLSLSLDPHPVCPCRPNPQDKRLDIVVVDIGSGVLTVLTATAAGGFESVDTSPSYMSLSSVKIADVDNDGEPFRVSNAVCCVLRTACSVLRPP